MPTGAHVVAPSSPMPLLPAVAQHSTPGVIDFRAPFADHRELMSRDNVHPNSQGYRVMAETAHAALSAPAKKPSK